MFLKTGRRKIAVGIFVLTLAGLVALGGQRLLSGSSFFRSSQTHGVIPKNTVGEYVFPWKPFFRGVEICRAWTDSPRLMKIYAVRVDLHEPAVRFLVTPSNGQAPGECGARTTSEFLREFGCQVAINGSVFGKPFAKQKGDPLDVIGLSLSKGKVYSRSNVYGALLIDKNNNCRIDAAPVDTRDAYNGLSGFRILLREGENLGSNKNLHPRSVVGISRDQRYLIMMVIDGRQHGYSESATTAEAAEWIRRLGAYNALNLDGGGSTTLVVEGNNGQPQILNRPSGRYERHVANHLGVYADPLRTKAE
jgi:hypothetical protein